jgi:hypothetical protein
MIISEVLAVRISRIDWAAMGQLGRSAVGRRRFLVGVSPTRQPLQPEATGAVMEVTKWLKPLVSVSRYTVTARVCRPVHMSAYPLTAE